MAADDMRFDDRVAIVTGAGRGLGREYALQLAARGARVVVNDVGAAMAGSGSDAGLAETVAAEITDAGGDAIANAADVTDPEQAATIAADALERFGRIDVVINNAGNLDPGALPELDVAMVERHVDIHAIGAFNVTKAAWPAMTERGYGRVVLVASVGLYGGGFLISYATAKGAVVSLGRSLADGGAPHGIKVNMIAPAAETRMVTDPDYRAKCALPPIDPEAEPDPTRGTDRVAPMVLVLAHEACPVSGEVMWAGLGRFARVFIAETRGIVAPDLGPEGLLARFDEVMDESGYLVHATTAEAVAAREAMIAEALGG